MDQFVFFILGDKAMQDSADFDLGTLLARVFTPVEATLPPAFQALLDRLEAEPRLAVPGRLSDRELRMELEAALPDLRAFARSLVRDRDVADDLVQETMMKAWAARDRFEPGSSFRAWTMTIARNHFYSQMRRRKFTAAWDEALASRALASPAAQEDRIHLRDLQAALDQLNAEQREALMLVTLGNMGYEEAASATGVAVGTIKSRVSRAREALAAQLTGSRPGAWSVVRAREHAQVARDRRGDAA